MPAAPSSAVSDAPWPAAAYTLQDHTAAFTDASAAPASSRWSALYSDALHSILQFASLGELHCVLSVNRHWSAAVLTMPSIRAERSFGDPNQHPTEYSAFDARVRSRLVRHLSSLGGDCWIPSAMHVQLLADLMPWLHSVQLRPEDCEATLSAMLLTRVTALRRLEVDFSETLQADVNQWITAISGLTKLESLGLRVHPADVSFAPLTRLVALRHFRLSVYGPVSAVSATQIADLCALRSVRHFEHAWTRRGASTFLVRTLQSGHALNWTTLQWVTVDEVLAALLGSLSCLTDLSLTLRWSSVHFLSQLLRLTKLVVLAKWDVDVDEFVDALALCQQLRSLQLSDLGWTSEQLSALLSCLPDLSALILHSFPVLESLGCFATPSLAASLTSLDLRGLPACPSGEVAHLGSLRTLQRLILHNLATPLNEQQTALFGKQSQRFPQLTDTDFT